MNHAASGLIVGRFQPFHNEHVAYALAAKKQCHFLWVGLTNFMQTALPENPGGGHRLQPESNPLNFCERYTLVSDALQDAGLNQKDFGIVPCPIENPTSILDIVPPKTICYLTINEEWGHEKATILREIGYPVTILWERPKTISGSMIREAIRSGDQSWKGLVPSSVAKNLESWDFEQRVLATKS